MKQSKACIGSEAATEGIRIEVEPDFMGEQEQDGVILYMFSYRITITNLGDDAATLRTRLWRIIDADGKEENVQGVGVVGYTPRLEPKMSFTYSSLCPIATLWGTMEGEYGMERDDGSRFSAVIGRFYLVHPTRSE